MTSTYMREVKTSLRFSFNSVLRIGRLSFLLGIMTISMISNRGLDSHKRS